MPTTKQHIVTATDTVQSIIADMHKTTCSAGFPPCVIKFHSKRRISSDSDEFVASTTGRDPSLALPYWYKQQYLLSRKLLSLKEVEHDPHSALAQSQAATFTASPTRFDIFGGVVSLEEGSHYCRDGCLSSVGGCGLTQLMLRLCSTFLRPTRDIMVLRNSEPNP